MSKPRTFEAPLPQLVRFADLTRANIVRNWPQLRRLIETQSFPPGRQLSSNCRAWTADEIKAWLDSRPLAGEQQDDESTAAAEVAP